MSQHITPDLNFDFSSKEFIFRDAARLTYQELLKLAEVGREFIAFRQKMVDLGVTDKFGVSFFAFSTDESGTRNMRISTHQLRRLLETIEHPDWNKFVESYL